MNYTISFFNGVKYTNQQSMTLRRTFNLNDILHFLPNELISCIYEYDYEELNIELKYYGDEIVICYKSCKICINKSTLFVYISPLNYTILHSSHDNYIPLNNLINTYVRKYDYVKHNPVVTTITLSSTSYIVDKINGRRINIVTVENKILFENIICIVKLFYDIFKKN